MAGADRVLTHQVDGDGPAVVLLNGGMMTLASWAPVAEALVADGRRVVRCDLRGQLLSPGDPPRTFDGHARDVAALLDHLAIERADLVGTSYGGEVAIALAADRPGLARSLIAIAAVDRATPSIAEGSEKTRAACRAILDGGPRAQLHDLLASEVYSPAWRDAHREVLDARRATAERIPAEWFRGVLALLAALDDFDFGPRLASIACPTLVIAGGADRVMPVDRVRAVADGIPGARFEVFAGSGHAVVLERTADLIDRIRTFLAKVARDADPGGESR